MNTTELRRRALVRAEAQSKSGPTFGKGECLMRTRKLYDAPAIGDFDGDRSADAEDGWKAAKHKHPTTTPGGVPAGVPVWWGGGSSDHGHVAITAGGGMCWSTDIKREGRYDLVPIAEISRKWGLPLLGWTEDINGVRVYDPPATPPKENPVAPLNWIQRTHVELAAARKSLEAAIAELRAADPGRTQARAQIPDLLERRTQLVSIDGKIPPA